MGTGTGLMAGGGIAGTLAALPMPLGSLTEPLSPRAFAGPGGMPLTPASWASDLPGAARRPRMAMLTNATLPIIHRREKIETSCARLMVGDPLPSCHIHGEELGDSAEVPMLRQLHPPGRQTVAGAALTALPSLIVSRTL